MVAPDSSPRPSRLWHAGTLTYTRVGLLMLGFWLLWGDFPWAMKDRAVGPSATLLIKQLGVSEFLYGLIIISFPNFTNIFLTPIISYISDRHRGRWGRRIPFLLFTTPFIVLGLYLLGLTQLLGESLHQWIPVLSVHYAKLLVFCTAWVILDFGSTLSGALFGALANDVVPRELLGRFFAMFRMVSLAAGMIYNEYLIKVVETRTLAIFLGIGTLYGIGLLSLCFMVKEGDYPPPEKPEKTGSVMTRVRGAVATYFRQSFSLPYYRWYMVASALGPLSFLPLNMFAIQYAQNLGISMQAYGRYLVITYICSLILSYFLGMLADRFHPLRAGMAALAGYALLMGGGYWLLRDGGHFGVVLILHGVVSGSYFTLAASLGARLLPRSLFAQFGSSSAMVGAFLSMLLAPVVGKSIDLCENNYRAVLLFGLAITLISLLLFLKIYRNYLRHGGDRNYIPPAPDAL